MTIKEIIENTKFKSFTHPLLEEEVVVDAVYVVRARAVIEKEVIAADYITIENVKANLARRIAKHLYANKVRELEEGLIELEYAVCGSGIDGNKIAEIREKLVPIFEFYPRISAEELKSK